MMSCNREIRVLLVDDEPSTHFLHKRVIKKAMPTASTISVMDGNAALEFIKRTHQGAEPCPTHIWLDLQMPNCDGWGFLEHYLPMAENAACRPVVTIITSSPNPKDQVRALGFPNVVAYVEKFMTPEECQRILSMEN